MQKFLDENILVGKKYKNHISHHEFGDKDLTDLTRFYDVEEWRTR